MEDDPFNEVRREVVQQMENVRSLYKRWQELIDNPSSKKDESEYGILVTDLQGLVQSIGWDLADLAETIQIVQANRQKFKKMSDEEIGSRKEFVESTKAEIEKIKKDLHSPAAKTMAKKMNRGALVPNDPRSRLDHEIEVDNDKFIQDQLTQTREMEKEQDQYLDSILHSVNTIEQVGHDMNEELERQNVIIEQLSEMADNTGERIRRTMKDIDKFIDDSSNTVSYSLIAILLLVVLGLLAAVIYL